jgi:hypothetical protein
MLVRFRVANHRSIRNEAELSFVAGDDSPFGRPVGDLDGLTVLPFTVQTHPARAPF